MVKEGGGWPLWPVPRWCSSDPDGFLADASSDPKPPESSAKQNVNSKPMRTTANKVSAMILAKLTSPEANELL